MPSRSNDATKTHRGLILAENYTIIGVILVLVVWEAVSRFIQSIPGTSLAISPKFRPIVG